MSSSPESLMNEKSSSSSWLRTPYLSEVRSKNLPNKRCQPGRNRGPFPAEGPGGVHGACLRRVCRHLVGIQFCPGDSELV